MAIIQFLSNPTNAAELIALVAALFILLNKKAGYWSFCIPYLLITILIEAAGYYFRVELKKPNYAFYNFFMIIQLLFFAFLFYKFHQSKKIKQWVPVFVITFILFFISEGIINSFASYNKYSRQFLSVFIVFFSCIFYFSILRDDTIKSPVKYPPFWIVTGLFFFYFGSIAMFAFYDKVSQIKLSGNLSFYTLVMGCLSCILYGSWIIGFICKKKQDLSFRQ